MLDRYYYRYDRAYYIPAEEFDSVLSEVIDFLKANQDWALDYSESCFEEDEETEHYFTLFSKRDW